jgi:hypothetical protein
VLRHRNLDVFCLNDTNSDSALTGDQAQLLADFLPLYFPFASPFELASHDGRTRRIEPPAAVPAQADRHAASATSPPDVPMQSTKKPVKKAAGPATKRVRKAGAKPAAAPTDA